MTIEFLIKIGHNSKRQGNVTLFDTGSPSVYGGGSRTWIDLSRHGFSFRMEATNQHKVGAQVLALSNGTGRASTGYLFDGEWHHIVVRRSTGGLATPGTIDAWIDGRVPESISQWFSRPGAGPYPWAATSLKPGGYFGQWSDGVWPDLVMLPSAFDGGIDEVALYEEALPDALIVQHYQDAMAHKPYSPDSHSNAGTAAAPPPDPDPEFDLLEYLFRGMHLSEIDPNTGVN